MATRIARPSRVCSFILSTKSEAHSASSKVTYALPMFKFGLSLSIIRLTSTSDPYLWTFFVNNSRDVVYPMFVIFTLHPSYDSAPFFLPSSSSNSMASSELFPPGSTSSIFDRSISASRPIVSSNSFSRFPKAVKNSSFKGITCGGSTRPRGRFGSNSRAAHLDNLDLAWLKATVFTTVVSSPGTVESASDSVFFDSSVLTKVVESSFSSPTLRLLRATGLSSLGIAPSSSSSLLSSPNIAT
mmetsp:Transcript_29296/g.39085  ORF Transcript_29296/g.39085 Transcript_29296/m.39085 type:complete len:242 (+) Transcript_29296:778-1503(+)